MPPQPHRSLSAWVIAWRIVKLNFRANLEYRSEFFLTIVVGVVWQASIIVFTTVLLGRFPGMGGWASHAVLMIAAMRMLSHGLFLLFFGRVVNLAVMVQAGQVDGYLLRPMPVYRQVQLSYFPSNAIGDLIVGVSMFTAAVTIIKLDWTAARIAYLAVGVLGGMLAEAAVLTAISSFHLHFPAAISWTHWLEELSATFGNYPLNILPTSLNAMFTYVMPLAFVAYFPAAVLTHHTTGLLVPWVIAVGAPVVGLALYLLSRLLWNVSLRHYTGVNG